MNQCPRVSVVLCSYNQSEYLSEAVESVLNQTYRDYELIIIDNGSTDCSPEILHKYCNLINVVVVLKENNAAITKRMNEGVSRARGEFVSFLYSDDYYLPDKLKLQVERIDQLGDDFGVVYNPAFRENFLTGHRWILPSFSGSGRVLADLLLDYQRGRQIDMLSPLTRKVCYVRYPFHEDVFAEGEEIFYRIAQTYQFSFLNEPLVVLRDHQGNRGKAIMRNAEMTLTCLDKLEKGEDFPLECREPLLNMRKNYYRNLGWQAVRLNGDVVWARACFFKAIKISWWQAFYPKTIAGFFLSFLPGPLRRIVNRFGHLLRRNPSIQVLVDSY